MLKILILLSALVLTACADMTPREKYWTAAAVGVVAAGAVAVYRERHEAQFGAMPRRGFDPVNCSDPSVCK